MRSALMMVNTLNPGWNKMEKLSTWLEVAPTTDFSIYNLPFGIFTHQGAQKKAGVAIGDQIIHLHAAHGLGIFDDIPLDPSTLTSEYLNDFIAHGKPVTNQVRTRLQESLCDASSLLKSSTALIPASEADLHMPVFVRDYTDFYSSIEHATNVGKMFRDPENALLPNWRHIPVGYHGRASSIVISGANVHRPMGQLNNDNTNPVYAPSGRVDFELEMAFIVGKETRLGETVSVENAEDHIFGMVVFNDWSARDVQKWEYVPLGPFLAKNFASSISPWVVTMEALDHFRIEGPKQEPDVLPYLQTSGENNYDIHLEVGITPEHGRETVVSKSNFKYMYWSMRQQLAHHTMNGCNISVGDMMASGTISGKDEQSYGSMLELAWAGTKPLKMDDGTIRKFIHDNDTVTMRAYCEKEGKRVGFGEVSSKLLPVKK